MSQKTLARVAPKRGSTHGGATVKAKPEARPSLAQSARAALMAQPALKMGRVNDACEKQADQVADRVVAGQVAVLSATRVETPRFESAARKPEPEEDAAQQKAETSRPDKAGSPRAESNDEEELQAKQQTSAPRPSQRLNGDIRKLMIIEQLPLTSSRP